MLHFCSRWQGKNASVPVFGHRRSQGVQWVHLHPQAVKKSNFMRNLQGKL